ncbi:hypothetical protein OG497_37690 [Streptomyces sp. NBC_01242]|uniref:hypothetical protein n=1 Tax=Streptomyces sp. NBC_01242 TaxID=2903795 RepID=UPI002256F6C3|nr:hypothetical protein [Streptomyces sp. NBC_01242]MCX4799591.1 hypothetical protein [Streptomyces sp. NBC_01242]
MSITSTPIGATLTYTPHGAFLPVDLEFPWATPDDMVFILAAFRARQGRGLVTRAEVVDALEEARESQMAWHADRMRLAMLSGLGRWAKVLPSRLIDRVVELAMNQYYESTAQWAVEMADLYEQVNSLSYRVSALSRAQGQARSVAIPAGPQILCAGGCGKGLPLARPLALPPGWTADERDTPRCPEHSVADVVTSSGVA